MTPFQKIKVNLLRKFAKSKDIIYKSIPKRILLDEIIKYFYKQEYFNYNLDKMVCDSLKWAGKANKAPYTNNYLGD